MNKKDMIFIRKKLHEIQEGLNFIEGKIKNLESFILRQ